MAIPIQLSTILIGLDTNRIMMWSNPSEVAKRWMAYLELLKTTSVVGSRPHHKITGDQ